MEVEMTIAVMTSGSGHSGSNDDSGDNQWWWSVGMAAAIDWWYCW